MYYHTILQYKIYKQLKRKVPLTMEFLNDWIRDKHYLDSLLLQFQTATPFPHVVIDNFFKPDIAAQIERAFPVPTSEQWNKYDNPIEMKFTLDKGLTTMEPAILASLWRFLQTDMLPIIQTLTGIPNLESDPHLHGAGFHYHPPGGKLEMHLDYSVHPITGKERRINLLIYMNPYWNPEGKWNGDLILTDPNKTCIKHVLPVFNRALIMRTSDISWHGMPHLIKCPKDYARKSIAVYYVSDMDDKNEESATMNSRPKAKFRPLFGLTDDYDNEEEYMKLCKLRDSRRLSHHDIPIEWKSSMQ